MSRAKSLKSSGRTTSGRIAANCQRSSFKKLQYRRFNQRIRWGATGIMILWLSTSKHSTIPVNPVWKWPMIICKASPILRMSNCSYFNLNLQRKPTPNFWNHHAEKKCSGATRRWRSFLMKNQVSLQSHHPEIDWIWHPELFSGSPAKIR